VSGICSTTISAPFIAMAIPKSDGEKPCAPIATGSDTYACIKISATRKDSPTTPMNRRSRSTVPMLTAGSATVLPSATAAGSGRDSGSLRKTRTAQASVSAPSIRKPAR
jgi:hypothetical protein